MIFPMTMLGRERASQALTYASDGDTNGVVYFLGTRYGLDGGFTNPQTRGTLRMLASGVLGGSEEQLIAVTDRTAGHFYTLNTANSFVTFDLGIASLILNGYSYRSRTGFAGDWPTAWVLEGSNNNSSWTTIHSLNPVSPAFSATDQWFSQAVVGQTVAYRFIRWRQTASNSAGSNYFVFGEAELYGTLLY